MLNYRDRFIGTFAMRTLYLTILCISVFLSSCTSYTDIDHVNSLPKNTPQKSKVMKKNPIAVTFYKKGERPPLPFKVLGKEVVSKYNLVGVKRQEASIHDAMRKLAANLGGDAVIDVNHDEKSVSGIVIAFQFPMPPITPPLLSKDRQKA